MRRQRIPSVIIVGVLHLMLNQSADAQTPRRPETRRSAAGDSSPLDKVGGWWNGQVRMFKRRWGLADPPTNARPAGRKPNRVRTAAYTRNSGAPRRHVVQPVAHQSLAVPNGAPQSRPIREAARRSATDQNGNADRTAKHARPATAGLGPGYPQFHGPLYPTPRPDIPYQTGGAVITNQAFSPHEMLYPHTYRALYPPFYYKVSGGWMVTPWGVWSSDSWKLEGTEVEVKYHPKISFLSGFSPPAIR